MLIVGLNTKRPVELNAADLILFAEHLKPTENGCVVWIGLDGKHKCGYGHINIGGVVVATHRLSWYVEHGTPPGDLMVLHKCDNRPCCNPNHLFLGTHQDNMNDLARRGRELFFSRSKPMAVGKIVVASFDSKKIKL